MRTHLKKPQFNSPISPMSIRRVSTGVFLAIGLVASSVLSSGIAVAKPDTKAPTQQALSSQTVAPASDLTLANGTYLYGESEQPDEIGKGYFVFEVADGKVFGALYMPHSSFDCAAGQFQAKQLALTVTNSYDRSTNPFQFALEKTATVASDGKLYPQIGLEGMHRLESPSKNDLRILNVCKADLEKSKQVVSQN